ncbi:carboxypeptidase-like regulatory domain-containing protein [Flavobacterium amnicola]|uniref:Carboxypeptidase-like regulatory domain-containing protein n=1 Tax=Flavobacterium amnicola TaxID=2506422 RepID=A0A4Q1K6H0_9FLAO|nr:DUF5686 family protein [Flavobacterium amnicola]RXR21267.1 carboxypeptidase-like regulatory domain-containing protein [Flavobacterium amnicola]
MLKKITLLLLFSFFQLKGSAQIKSTTIIEKAILSKKLNFPNNFQLTTYNKLIITANPDFVEGNIDSIFVMKKGKKVFKEIDSSDCEFKKIISKQHLYQTEKISVITQSNLETKEEILSTKMAGFKEPIYEYFSVQLQPFSMYDKKLILVENEYTNPISINGLNIYTYQWLETIERNNRKIHVIQFKPKRISKTDKLEGKLYIDAQKFSIASAEYKIRGKINITSSHFFDFNEKLNNWFPKKSTLTIKKGNSKYPIKILGETITFDGSDSNLNPLGKKYASDFLEIKSENQYSQITFGINGPIKKKHIAISISEKAINRKEELWYTYFNDSTDVRSKATYVSLDSLIESRKIENKLKIGRKIIKGYYPLGFFDFDLRYLIRYNNYEGFRMGLGGVTNEKFSKFFKVEGYMVYGTKDGAFKGHLSNAFRVNKTSETWLGLSYKDDVSEIANTAFEIDKKPFKIYDPRPLNLSTFYNHETWKGFLETKIIPKTEAALQVTQSFIEPKFDYEYIINNHPSTDFKITAVTTSIQWNPFSKFMQTPNGILETDKNYPKFTFQVSKSIPGLWHNSYDFGKLDFRVDLQKKFNSNHKILFLFESGYAFGNTPLTHLYNHSPNNLTKDKIIQRVTFAAKDSFETMYFNEFFSDKYLYLHMKHQFPKLEISRQIKPVLSLVSRYGIGELEHKERHKGLEFKTLEHGFYESGFEMNQIFKGIGFTAFYRYGPNQLPSFEDNIALKLSIQINLGFNN